MLVIKVIGGLGNQMFQYALYLRLKKEGKKVKLDVRSFKDIKIHNGYELPYVFNVGENTVSLKDLLIRGFCKFKNSVLAKGKLSYFEDTTKYNENIFQLDGIYLKGYWQNVKYLEGIEAELTKDFTFPNRLDSRNQKILDEIKNTHSVSIHIRRGDYVATSFDGICTLTYYKKAIEMLKAKIPDLHFFIFSNDIEWCKKNIHVPRSTYVYWNQDKNSYIDMQLMSQCQHNIIANSSFSWWAAWLNNNKEKMIVAPSEWSKAPIWKNKINDLVPKEWIQINH